MDPADVPSPSSDDVRAEAGRARAVRAEAARAADRLGVARERVAAARGPAGVGSDGAAGSDVAWGGRDDVDDDMRSLLAPAVDRISRLADIAAASADGTLSDGSAAEAARAIAAAQPHRRPR